MFHSDLQHTGQSGYVGPSLPAIAWSYLTCDDVASSPALGSDGAIYVGSDDNMFYAYSSTGTLSWSYATEGDISSSPAISATQEIYVGSEDKQFYSFDSIGGLSWSYTHPGGGVEDRWKSSPVIGSEGAIYMQARNGLCVLGYYGILAWSFNTDAADSAHPSSPAIGTDGRIYWGSGDRDVVYAVTSDRSLAWSYTTGGTLQSSPAIGSDGSVYIGCYDNNVYAYTSAGAIAWSYLTGGDVYSSPAIDATGSVYVGSRDNNLYVFSEGTLLWSYAAGMNVDSSPAVDVTGMMYVGAQDKMLYAFNPDGTLSGGCEAGSWFDSSSAIGFDGMVYIGSHDNNAYAICTAIPTATPDPNLPIVLISEVLYDPAGDDNGHSFIELVGFSGRDISGWKIVGIDGDNGSIDEQFTFPPSSVFPDDGEGLGLLVVADEATGVTYVSNYDFTDPDMDLSNGPDNVRVIDNYGRVIDALAYDSVTPGDNNHFGFFAGEGTAAGSSDEGYSLVRFPALLDTNDNSYDFAVDYPNPGYAAGVQSPASAPVKISEVLYDAVGQDEGRTFIELVGPVGTDISGWRLMGVDPDSGQSELIFMFPPGALFSDEGNSLGLLVVADTNASEITYVTPTDYTASSVNLPNGKYNIQLKDIDGSVVDALGYDAVSPGSSFNFGHFAGEGSPAGNSGEGYSLARHPDGNSDTDDNAADFEPQAPNPGVAVGVQPTPTPGATPSVTPTPPSPPAVKISELYYDPSGYDNGRAFVEIIGPAGTDAGEWYLVGIDGDTGEEAQSYRFPEHAIIPDDGNGLGLLVVADLNEGQTEVENYDYAAVEIDFANGPDNLELRDAWGQVVDSLAYDLDSPGNNNHFAYFHGEGTAAGSSGAGLSLGRHPTGYSDTGDNAVDFEPQAPNPGMAVGVQPTPTPTETPTVAPTETTTITPSPTISPTPTITYTPEPTITPGGPPTPTPTETPLPADPLSVVINEIGWMGTKASPYDEWIELYNNTASAISLAGWTLRASSGSPDITLSGTISAHGYYLLECGDDTTISGVAADKIYQGALSNDGEGLELKDHTGQVIDSVNGGGGPWPAGSNEPVKYSMERIDPASSGTDSNWIYNDGRYRNGLDADENGVNGTPKDINSVSADSSIYSVGTRDIVINEVAWMGTQADDQDEWLELFNNTGYVVNLGGFKITSQKPGEGEVALGTLLGSISPGGYYLIERHDSAVTDIAADLVAPYGGNGLLNTGEALRLKDRTGSLIDTSNIGGNPNPWPAGENVTQPPPAVRISMERINPRSADIDRNWSDNNMGWSNGLDSANNPIKGTPRKFNSIIEPPSVVINEVAWMGTAANSEHEWIELHNNTNASINLSGWQIEGLGAGSNAITIPSGKSISAKGFFIIADNANVFNDITEDYCDSSMELDDDGELLVLRDSSNNVIDRTNRVNQIYSEGWYAGSPTQSKLSMERVYSRAPGVSEDNWDSNDGQWTNGHDANGDPINGSPGMFNSSAPPYIDSVNPDDVPVGCDCVVTVTGSNFKPGAKVYCTCHPYVVDSFEVGTLGNYLKFRTDDIDSEGCVSALAVANPPYGYDDESNQYWFFEVYDFSIFISWEAGSEKVDLEIKNVKGLDKVNMESLKIEVFDCPDILDCTTPTPLPNPWNYVKNISISGSNTILTGDIMLYCNDPFVPSHTAMAATIETKDDPVVEDSHVIFSYVVNTCPPTATPTPTPTPIPTNQPGQIDFGGHCISWPASSPSHVRLYTNVAINPGIARDAECRIGFYACLAAGQSHIGSGPCWRSVDFSFPTNYRVYEYPELPCIGTTSATNLDACLGFDFYDGAIPDIYDTLHLDSCTQLPASQVPPDQCPPASWLPCAVHEGCDAPPSQCVWEGSSSAMLPGGQEYDHIARLVTEQRFPVGSHPRDAAPGDFNGDGEIDLAVTNLYSKDISMFVGNGDGSLAPEKRYSAEGFVYQLSSADYNNDGRLDMAVANWGGYSVSVFLNQGSGIFSSPVKYGVANDPMSVTSGDFNRDGNVDLAVTNTGSGSPFGSSISVLIGNGDGTFNPETQYSVGEHPDSIVTFDFNGDGNLDFAVANRWANSVSILLGKGDGALKQEVRYPTGMNPFCLIASDLNNDGKLDLVTTNSDRRTPDEPYGSISVLMGNGDGTFFGEMRYDIGELHTSLTSLDWDMDGKADLALTDTYYGKIDIMFGKGDGTFYGKTSYPVGQEPKSIKSADFNKDGKPDLAVANFDSNDVSILINDNVPGQPTITVTPVTPFPTPTPTPKPVELRVSGESVRPGEGFRMELLVNRQISMSVFDAYVVALTPWGVYSINSELKWEKGVRPVLSGVNIIEPCRVRLLDVPRVPGWTAGNKFTFIAGVVESPKPLTEENAIYMDKKVIEVISGSARARGAVHKKLVRALTHGLARLL